MTLKYGRNVKSHEGKSVVVYSNDTRALHPEAGCDTLMFITIWAVSEQTYTHDHIMKFSNRSLILLVWISWALGSPNLFASPTLTERTECGRIGCSWWLLGGNLGFTSMSTSVSGEAGKQGVSGDVKLIHAIYTNSWVWDIAFGLNFKSIMGTRSNGTNIYVTYGAYLLELNPRYKLTETLQIGPFVDWIFGTDVSHKPTVQPIDLNEQATNSVFLLGLQAIYEFPEPSWPVRLGVRAYIDLTVPRRNVIAVEATAHLALPCLSSCPSKATKKAAPPKEARKPKSKPEVELSEIKFHFLTASDELRSSSEKMLREIASYLSKHPKKFEAIHVEAHTDSRGKRSYNKRLSKDRADTVYKILREYGIPPGRLSATGYGPDRPIDSGNSEEAHARNRRVLIRISGSETSDGLKSDILDIADKY